MLRIAITGGIACGKTLVGSFFKELGIPVCESDELGHDLFVRGSIVFDKVLFEFGSDILGEDGSIDRGKLGKIVFGDRTRLELLNAIMHPEIERGWQNWLAMQDTVVASVIIPLLYEGAYESGWDYVLCVSASESLQVARLRDRMFDDLNAVARIKSQLVVSEKMERSEFVIMNNGSVKVVREQVKRILANILEK